MICPPCRTQDHAKCTNGELTTAIPDESGYPIGTNCDCHHRSAQSDNLPVSGESDRLALEVK